MIEFEEKDYSEELNPCPFCGEDHVSQVFNGSDQYISSFWVMCGNCDAEGPVDKTEDGAVEKWNNRCKYAPEIPIEQTYGQKATDCCGVKNDEGDYVAAARKETFEKLEPLRKALFNIARDSEVSCNTKIANSIPRKQSRTVMVLTVVFLHQSMIVQNIHQKMHRNTSG